MWIHGDLHPGNLLVRDGRLSGVLDFGDLTAGDPATDLSVAWMLLRGSARSTFRDLTCGAQGWLDDDTWTRARAWALALGAAYLAHAGGDDRFAAVAAATIGEVMLGPVRPYLAGQRASVRETASCTCAADTAGHSK